MKIAKKEETIGKFFSLNLVMSNFLFSVTVRVRVRVRVCNKTHKQNINNTTKYKQHYQI